MFKPRPNQARILEYDHGRMGISAVPGSGKTHTLSFLAAQLILQGRVSSEQEILIVTLVNSAVDNFSTRIAGFVRQAGLLENVGYRIRTLHGLAHDIVRERPDLAAVSDQFSIIDESETAQMIDLISTGYLREHPEIAAYLLKPGKDTTTDFKVKKAWFALINTLNQDFIKKSKDLQAEPADIIEKIAAWGYSDPLIEMGLDVFMQYQRGLRYRGALDFSDLVRLAYRVLESDNNYLDRLQARWPYILEDEAQDSSAIQEKVLRMLVGEDGNWVRVGDPNQAIYETFTTADPKFLLNFLDEEDVLRLDLPNSGRSAISIINLANSLIDWTNHEHPVSDLRGSLVLPHIEPAPADDPQPNPPDHPLAIFILEKKVNPEEETRAIVESLKRWLPAHPGKTVAVLCPIAGHGEKVAEAIQKAGLPLVELLKTSQSTRKTARIMEKILFSLAAPSNTVKFTQAFMEIASMEEIEPEDKVGLVDLQSNLRRISNLEELLYPVAGESFHTLCQTNSYAPRLNTLLVNNLNHFIRWQKASDLPIDQLILLIAQDLFTVPADLALAHKLAVMLEFNARVHPEYELTHFAAELANVSTNARKFSGFSDEETRFDPDAHKGKVFISTYHKAKGLEWDRVYLLSVNNYDFPSAQPYDLYVGEKWFLRENFNPQAEILDQLESLIMNNEQHINKYPGNATMTARLEYAAERLRLLYVGITRARESLVISWNTGRSNDKQMALPLTALTEIWKGNDAAS